MVATGSAEAKRGKICGGGSNANEENFAFVAMHGKTYGSCCHARENLWRFIQFRVTIQLREIMQLLS